MRILAIETSCDETAISVLETSGRESASWRISVLAHEVSSQISVHKEWGGVVPMLAKREHLANLPVMFEKVGSEKIDLVAVTYGPGLEPALWTGINFAKELATKLDVPLVATDHMHGHIVSALLELKSEREYELKQPKLPAIALLISGGHTQLVLMSERDNFEIVGNTRDDAVGEAFDKVARILGLPYPGGPEISKLATKFPAAQAPRISGSTAVILPRPMLHSGDLDFSFSGLKTAVLYLVKKIKEENKRELTDEEKIAIAYEFEQAVTEVLIKKTLGAIEKYTAKSLLVGGGVIANRTIRERLAKEIKVPLYLPDNRFTGDNATMIGIAGYLRSNGGTTNILSPSSPEFASLKATGNLSLYK